MDFNKDRAAQGQLVEIDEEQYHYMLDVLPPIYARGCFAMGEPVAHTTDGVTFHWAGKCCDRYFACYGTRRQAELAFMS
jgi:hypothetical protein